MLVFAALLHVVAFAPADPMGTIFLFTKYARREGLGRTRRMRASGFCVGSNNGINSCLGCVSEWDLRRVIRVMTGHLYTWVSSTVFTPRHHCSTSFTPDEVLPSTLAVFRGSSRFSRERKMLSVVVDL
jgi:hypothetical protein